MVFVLRLEVAMIEHFCFVAAQTGHNVTLVEVNDGALKKAESGIAKSLQRVAKKLHKDVNTEAAQKFIAESQARIKGVTDPTKALENCDLVVEAIVENLETKHKLFKVLDKAAPAKTMFASNTSSLSIGEIASVCERKDRFGGLHFFNPVAVMKLLEVIRIPETSEETYQAFMAWGKAMGKVTVTCKDTPGFIVNRLLIPYSCEAVRMLERGDATAEDIDTAMKLGAGYPMGPLELADYSGHDLGLAIIEDWHKKFPDNPVFEPSETVRKMVKEGKLGVKSGEGFYKYGTKSKI